MGEPKQVFSKVSLLLCAKLTTDGLLRMSIILNKHAGRSYIMRSQWDNTHTHCDIVLHTVHWHTQTQYTDTRRERPGKGVNDQRGHSQVGSQQHVDPSFAVV